MRIRAGLVAVYAGGLLAAVAPCFAQQAAPSQGSSELHSPAAPPQTGVQPLAGSASSSSFLVRPAAAVAARNDQRSGFAWILRQLGTASETLLDRLAGEDLGPVFSELQEQAFRGDPSAVNIVGWISAQRCHGRPDEVLDSYLQYQLTQAQELPSNDAGWFAALIRVEADYDKKINAACTRLDSGRIAALVTRRAENGDPASQFLKSREGDDASNLWLRKAADAGLAQAKFEIAWDILGRQPRRTPASYSAMTELREAAGGLPLAEASLAVCEYSGCEDTAPDVASALTHAHEAAIRGRADGFLEIGAQLPGAQAQEFAAWKLIHASLQQRGCSVSNVSIPWMKSIAADISSASTMPGALKLASELWQAHGQQMMSALGCAS